MAEKFSKIRESVRQTNKHLGARRSKTQMPHIKNLFFFYNEIKDFYYYVVYFIM